MKKLLSLALALALSVTLVACGNNGDGSGSGSGGGSGSGSETSGDTIRIGIAAPLTGTSASYGELMVDGAQIAIDEINEAGGVNGKMLELVQMDDKNDPSEAALVAQIL